MSDNLLSMILQQAQPHMGIARVRPRCIEVNVMSLVNIDSLGYGKIYKTIMRDKTLPALAKAIYAYFCSFAGCGYTAFPKRDRITRDLQINKDTFTKHLATLIGNGLISKERTAHGNLYIIIQSIPAYDDPAFDQTTMSDKLVFENVQAKGFGTVPKLLMFDARLSAQAKAIYAYFCSFAGAGTTAFPRQTTIMREMKMSKDTYYSHFNQLVELRYISVEHRKRDGRFIHSIYRLNSDVEMPVGAMSEKAGHGGKPLKTYKPMSENSGTEKAVSEKMGSGNLGHPNIKNSSITNNSFEKEQDHNHQALFWGNDERYSYFSLQQVKEAIGYATLIEEARVLAQLKEALGHFDFPDECKQFRDTAHSIVKELVSILWEQLKSGDMAQYTLIKLVKDGTILQLFYDVSEQWKVIRNIRRYVAAAINNSLDNQACLCS